MTQSTASHQREDAPLLRIPHDSLVPYTQPQSPLRSGGIFRWIFGILGTGGVAGTQGYFAVTSFVAKSTISGGVFGAGALVCAGACVYCVYRVVNAIKSRNIQPIAPTADITAARTNLQMLRMVHTRLNTLLSVSPATDLEAGVSDVQLHEAINGQLGELEQMLPQLRTELGALKASIEATIASRGANSPGSFASPGVDSSYEQGLLNNLDKILKTAAKDRLSRNSSRLSSATTSPTSGYSPRFATASPALAQSPVARRIPFGNVQDGGTPLSPISPGDENK